jgi:hypothetical protein
MSLATVPLLLERMLSDDKFPAWWGTADHYNAYLVVVLLCAAADGAARLDRSLVAWRGRAARAGPVEGQVESPGEEAPAARGAGWVAFGCAAAMCVVALILVPRFAFGPALHPSFYQRDANMRAAAAADAVVPSGVTVAASDYLGPQLSARDTVLLWDGDGYTNPTAAPWVVADVRKKQFTFKSVREQRQAVAMLERDGYKLVFSRDGYIVLHRAGPVGNLSSKEAVG